MRLARFLTAGVAVWLNTPHKLQEASGTSDMKADLNRVPSLSVLDGRWIEGHVEGVSGWSIGDWAERVFFSARRMPVQCMRDASSTAE